MFLEKENLSEINEWLKQASDSGACLLVNKDKDWTSFDVVKMVKKVTKAKKVGHAGTLDPLATGLLILCFGKFTKRITEFQDLKKTYLAEFKFGATTKTDDSEMAEENVSSTDNLTLKEIESVIKNYIGDIVQIPPIFSAKKINGKRSYKMARKDVEFEPRPTHVSVYSIKILSWDNPFLKLEIECSKGTYIRSLARDIGKDLEVGAYMSSLVRTKIGDFSADKALEVREFVKAFDNNKKLMNESI